MKLIIRPSAEKQFAKLDSDIQERIHNKLVFFLSADDPLAFAERLKDMETGQYRFRIGDWRVIFDLVKDTIFVLSVGHRREVYK
jgi:mRNA interferase RelE/StbE